MTSIAEGHSFDHHGAISPILWIEKKRPHFDPGFHIVPSTIIVNNASASFKVLLRRVVSELASLMHLVSLARQTVSGSCSSAKTSSQSTVAAGFHAIGEGGRFIPGIARPAADL